MKICKEEDCLDQKALNKIVPGLLKMEVPQHHISVAGRHSSSYEDCLGCITFSFKRKTPGLARNSTKEGIFSLLSTMYTIYNLSRTLIVMGTLPALWKWRGDDAKAHSLPYKYWWINCRREGVKENYKITRLNKGRKKPLNKTGLKNNCWVLL